MKINNEMRQILTAMLKKDGRNLSKCENCGAKKLEGRHSVSTLIDTEAIKYQDLSILCGKCIQKGKMYF